MYYCVLVKKLCQSRLLSWNVAPLLDHRLLDLPWVCLGPCADLIRNINTLLSRLKLGHKFGDMLAGSLWLKRTIFLGSILDNSLGLVITLFLSFLESTSRWSTDLPWFLGTPCDWCELLHRFLLNTAHLLGPFRTLGVGCVARGFILTLLLNLSLALNNIILNIMFLLLSPALRFILSPTNLRSLNLTILNQRFSANVHCLLDSNLLILNEAAFPKVLLTFFLLLRVIVCHIGCVASLVIRVVTLDNIIILSFFNHLYFVNTFLTSFSNSCKAYGSCIFTLT